MLADLVNRCILVWFLLNALGGSLGVVSSNQLCAMRQAALIHISQNALQHVHSCTFVTFSLAIRSCAQGATPKMKLHRNIIDFAIVIKVTDPVAVYEVTNRGSICWIRSSVTGVAS